MPYEIVFAQKGKRLSLPEKAGELLASMTSLLQEWREASHCSLHTASQ